MAGPKGYGSRSAVTVRGSNGTDFQEVGTGQIASTPEGPYGLMTLAYSFSNIGQDENDIINARLPGLVANPIPGRDAKGTLYALPPLGVTEFDNPAAATQAIAILPSVPSMRRICTAISARLIIPATVNQPIISLQLLDDVTPIWAMAFGVGAATVDALTQDIHLTGLGIAGSLESSMTLQFSAAGAAGTVQSVALTGFSTS